MHRDHKHALHRAHISQTETQHFPNEPLAIAYNVDKPSCATSTCFSIKLMLMVLKCACVPLYLLAADLLSIASIVPSLFVFNLQEIKRWKERQTVSQSAKEEFLYLVRDDSFIHLGCSTSSFPLQAMITARTQNHILNFIGDVCCSLIFCITYGNDHFHAHRFFFSFSLSLMQFIDELAYAAAVV